MKLSFEQFRLQGGFMGSTYYYNYPKNTDSHPYNWPFNVEKKEVFAFLHWEPNPEHPSHIHESDFPEFYSVEQIELFLHIAIKLHNEKQDT